MFPKSFRPFAIAILIALMVIDFRDGSYIVGWITTLVMIILSVAYIVDYIHTKKENKENKNG